MSDIARVLEISTSTGLGTTPSLHTRAAVVSGANGRVVVVVVVEVVVDVEVVVEVVVEDAS